MVEKRRERGERAKAREVWLEEGRGASEMEEEEGDGSSNAPCNLLLCKPFVNRLAAEWARTSPTPQHFGTGAPAPMGNVKERTLEKQL